MPSNMVPTDLELEHVLRHLVHTEPSIRQWMEMGNVQRGALNGLADASNFNRGTEERIKGLVNAIILLAKKCTSLERAISEMR